MSDSRMVGQRDSVFERDDVEPLLSGYRPLPGIFDEMVDRDGRVRAHWQPLLAMLTGLGPKELSRRFAAADRHRVIPAFSIASTRMRRGSSGLGRSATCRF